MEELERTTSAREMLDWSVYSTLEPWGAERDNMHAGIVAAMLFNVHRGKDTEPRTFSDFMLREQAPGEDGYAKTRKFVASLRAIAKPRKVK